MTTGDLISIDSPLTLMIGSGLYSEEDENLDYVDPVYHKANEDTLPEEDDFEEVKIPE